MGSWQGLYMRYGDKHTYKNLVDLVEVQALGEHLFYCLGLAGVRDGGQGMHMGLILKAAQKQNQDDVFIEWANEYTPFVFSSKKKRFVNKGAGKWRLEDAFFNPRFCSKKVLESEVDKFLGESCVDVDVEDFFKYITDRINSLDRKIEKRIKNNCEKKGEVYSPDGNVSDNFFEACDDDSLGNESDFKEQQKIIKKYLEKNPLPDFTGSLGLPQSKYRYGTFGLNSMEFDIWRKH